MASPHELPLDTPILFLPCTEAFEGLSDKERRYAHHLSRASWWGAFITLCQNSPEAPDIFCLLTRLFRSQPIDSIKRQALEKGVVSEDEFQSVLIYYSGVLFNCGNYLGYGDRKFVPSIQKEQLLGLVKISKAYLEEPEIIMKLYSRAVDRMYNLEECVKFLGMPPNGVTTYFSPNCTQKDAELCKRFMITRNIPAWNTKLIKHEVESRIIYDIRLASIETDACEGITVKEDKFENNIFTITRGDYSDIFREMVKEIAKAKEFAANDDEVNMLDKYIESFTTGSISAHKEGSTSWVRNKSPAVEFYTGFLEVYKDPMKQRADFTSFVAMVIHEQSKMFNTLVEKAEKEILPLLPWEKDFENDEFKRPDFSTLDIMTYATSITFNGINIPNYKDVKEEEGFKNVSMNNIIVSRERESIAVFLSEEDSTLREKVGSTAMNINIGLHELLGHGTGKFLRRKDDTTLNFDPSKMMNPFTGEKVTFYESGENYESKFTNIASAYEECRAEAVSLYLCLNDDVLDIFNVTAENKDDVKYIIWLNMFLSAIKGLEMYQEKQRLWGQAHANARYVILQVALEAEGLVNIKETVDKDDHPDLLLTLDRSKIATIGKETIGSFLRKLQVYRSMGDSDSGRSMFERYSQVESEGKYPFAKWLEVVNRKRRPRMIFTMPNTRLNGDKVNLVEYPDGVEGKIASWLERFTVAEHEKIEKILSQYSLTRFEPK